MSFWGKIGVLVGLLFLYILVCNLLASPPFLTGKAFPIKIKGSSKGTKVKMGLSYSVRAKVTRARWGLFGILPRNLDGFDIYILHQTVFAITIGLLLFWTINKLKK